MPPRVLDWQVQSGRRTAWSTYFPRTRLAKILYIQVLAILFASEGLSQEVPMDTDEIKALTFEQAKALAQRNGPVPLGNLATLLPEAVHLLAQQKGLSLRATAR